MAKYIERERIEKFFDGIYDCADLTFEPNDHCCAADDCAHCKWRETMNAIQKCILSIPTADVRPVKKARWKPVMLMREDKPDIQGKDEWYGPLFVCDKCSWTMIGKSKFCPNCGADMREVIGG